MIPEELSIEAVGMLGTAAAMLVEDAHFRLLARPVDRRAAAEVAEVLQHLGTDLTALGAAAAVLGRRDE